MKIKRYFASDIRQAIRRVREEQGPDAVILSNRKVEGGIEIVAAVDYDESMFDSVPTEPEQSQPTPIQPEARYDDFSHELKEDEFRPSAASMRRSTATESRPQARPQSHQAARQSQRPSQQAKPQSEPVDPTAEPFYEQTHQASSLERQMSEVKRERRHADPEWAQDPALVSMKNELRELRGLVEQQLSGFAWGNMERQHPLHARLMRHLMQLGLTASESKRIAMAVNEKSSYEQAWRLALAILGQSLAITEDDILNDGGVVALVGPTGVGKTTSIAKLAARYTLRHGAEKVALVTTDNYRIGAQEQLRTFGRILGVPVFVAKDYQELEQTIIELDDKELVLIDTAGMSPRDMRLTEQLSMLRSAVREVKCYLVLSANSQVAGLEASVTTFQKVGLEGCIISKIDESASLGEVLSTIMSHNLPVAYISDGQQVPEDLHPARSQDLVVRCVEMAKKQNQSISDVAVELQFGKVAVNA